MMRRPAAASALLGEDIRHNRLLFHQAGQPNGRRIIYPDVASADEQQHLSPAVLGCRHRAGVSFVGDVELHRRSPHPHRHPDVQCLVVRHGALDIRLDNTRHILRHAHAFIVPAEIDHVVEAIDSPTSLMDVRLLPTAWRSTGLTVGRVYNASATSGQLWRGIAGRRRVVSDAEVAAWVWGTLVPSSSASGCLAGSPHRRRRAPRSPASRQAAGRRRPRPHRRLKPVAAVTPGRHELELRAGRSGSGKSGSRRLPDCFGTL